MEVFEYEPQSSLKNYQNDSEASADKSKKEHRNNIDAIFTAGIDALDVIKAKSPFSVKKLVHFRKAKKKLIKFKKMNIKGEVDIYEILNIFYTEFETVETNSFSGSQKDFAYNLNRLLLKVKSDLTDNYESFVKMKFIHRGPNRRSIIFVNE